MDIIQQCKEYNLPPLRNGDQYYSVEIYDGGQIRYRATRSANALEIVSNCIRIAGMDWAEVLHNARTSGLPNPKLDTQSYSSPDSPEPEAAFEFGCGTFRITGHGPLDFDEVKAGKKRLTPSRFDLDRELALWSTTLTAIELRIKDIFLVDLKDKVHSFFVFEDVGNSHYFEINWLKDKGLEIVLEEKQWQGLESRLPQYVQAAAMHQSSPAEIQGLTGWSPSAITAEAEAHLSRGSRAGQRRPTS
jgi:hypothetical protein